jgi:hypothetical protein
MAGERYAERAVEALSAYLEAHLPSYLRSVEEAQALALDSLADPVAYLRGEVHNDNRSPLVEVWTEGGDASDQPERLWYYDATAVLSFSGDADVIGGQLRARRYLTAIAECLHADRTLDGAVESCIESKHDLAYARNDNSETRHAIAVTVEVRVHEGA